MRVTVLSVVVGACAGAAPEAAKEPPPPPQPQPPSPQAIANDTSGNCEPMPKVDDPCSPGDSWCIVDWGDPGGHSEALWCRNGKWELEIETNLAEDDGLP